MTSLITCLYCDTKAKARNLCMKHYKIEYSNDQIANYPSQRKTGYLDRNGYIREGRSGVQHRLVMEEFLGRKLLPHENVHHINGIKIDNRISNLELWITKQPKGQRVPDLVTHAIEILREYAPELLEGNQVYL